MRLFLALLLGFFLLDLSLSLLAAAICAAFAFIHVGILWFGETSGIPVDFVSTDQRQQVLRFTYHKVQFALL